MFLWGSVEKCLVLVCGSKLSLCMCGDIEMNLVLEQGYYWLDYSSGVEIISTLL